MKLNINEDLIYLRPYGKFDNKEITFFIDVVLTEEPLITNEELTILILCCFEIRYYEGIKQDIENKIDKYRKGETLCFG